MSKLSKKKKKKWQHRISANFFPVNCPYKSWPKSVNFGQQKKVVLFCIKIIMLKRRRGQNASINPALEHIEVDADILRASLTCELCKNILREANTVVCFLY